MTNKQLVRMLVNAALSMRAEAAADMINGIAEHDNATATYIGRYIRWIDVDFAKRVFDELARLQLAGGVAA